MHLKLINYFWVIFAKFENVNQNFFLLEFFGDWGQLYDLHMFFTLSSKIVESAIYWKSNKADFQSTGWGQEGYIAQINWPFWFADGQNILLCNSTHTQLSKPQDNFGYRSTQEEHPLQVSFRPRIRRDPLSGWGPYHRGVRMRGE